MQRDCNNCSRPSVDQICPMSGADTTTCLSLNSRPFWKPVLTDKEKLVDFLKKGKEAKTFNRDQEGMPCDFCSHHVNNETSFCASCDPENSNYDAYEFEVQAQTEDDPYHSLNQVLMDAQSQASSGKGKERHADNNSYEDQVICVVGRLLKDHPFGAHAYQIIKKTIEAGRLYKIKGSDAAYQEMLGAINYAGAMSILIKEKD